MEPIVAILAQHSFFKDLEPRYLDLLAGCAKNVRFDAGTVLFREGEPANEFLVLRFGKVALEITGPGGREIVIQTLGEGDLVGWSWLLPPYRWHFAARAVELTRAFALDGACLRQKMQEDHDLGYELYKRFTAIMLERLQATRLQLLDIYAAPQ